MITDSDNRYTLLIGRPPFQTKDVKAIYKRIRENRYEFPADKEISATAQDLIMSILNPDPGQSQRTERERVPLTRFTTDKRPTLEAILTHSFFHDGPFPSHIPASANDVAPDFRYLTTIQSRRNMAAVCQRSKLGVKLPIFADNTKPRPPLGPSIMQQERDFKNAVQPDSPISALLKYAFEFLPVEAALILSLALLVNLLFKPPHKSKNPLYSANSLLQGLKVRLARPDAEAERRTSGPRPYSDAKSWKGSAKKTRVLKRMSTGVTMLPYERGNWQRRRPGSYRRWLEWEER